MRWSPLTATNTPTGCLQNHAHCAGSSHRELGKREEDKQEEGKKGERGVRREHGEKGEEEMSMRRESERGEMEEDREKRGR